MSRAPYGIQDPKPYKVHPGMSARERYAHEHRRVRRGARFPGYPEYRVCVALAAYTRVPLRLRPYRRAGSLGTVQHLTGTLQRTLHAYINRERDPEAWRIARTYHVPSARVALANTRSLRWEYPGQHYPIP